MECTISSIISYFSVVFCVLFSVSMAVDNWQGKSVRWSKNCDFPGNDIGNQTTTGDRCGSICQHTFAECTHFTFRPTLVQGGIDGTCWFKSGPVSPSQAIPLHMAGAGCGYLTISWVQENFLSWSYNCNFPGGDFESQIASAEDCGPICMKNPQCTHFFWTIVEGQGGICFLKSGEISRENAITTPGSRGAICGLRHRDPTGPAVIDATPTPWSDTDTCQCFC